MTMWFIIMLVSLILVGGALLYLCSRIQKFHTVKKFNLNPKQERALSVIIIFGLFLITTLFINLVNAFVCTIYFAMIWGLCDLISLLIHKLNKKTSMTYYAGIGAIILSLAALSAGWYLDHNVWRTEYNLITSKKISPLKVVMFADSHTGTTFKGDGFKKHMQTIQQEQPDILIVAGDFVDDDTSKEDMIATSKALGEVKTKYGVYFIFGNHDNGYYEPNYRGYSGSELIEELQKNNIKVLRDEVVEITPEIYLIGRRDYSVEKENKGHRKNMNEFISNLDKNKYIIVADHQPADYNNQAKAQVDLVLSGHTHGGQLFPFNQVGKWIGANDRIYGHEKRNKTDFLVTSGLSDWSIKFKTGTKSEYVVINIRNDLSDAKQ